MDRALPHTHTTGLQHCIRDTPPIPWDTHCSDDEGKSRCNTYMPNFDVDAAGMNDTHQDANRSTSISYPVTRGGHGGPKTLSDAMVVARLRTRAPSGYVLPSAC